MTRIERFLLHTYVNLKILGQSDGCFYPMFSKIIVHFDTRDSLNLIYANRDLISVFRWVDRSAWMSQDDYIIEKLILRRNAHQ